MTGHETALLSVGRVATELGVSVGTIRRWSDAGAINAARTPGGQRRFSRDEVRRVRDEMWRRGSGNAGQEVSAYAR